MFISLRDQAAVAADYEWSIAQAGPLAGVILAVKDNVDVAGLATTAACPGYSYLPEADAPVVAALRTGRRGSTRQNQPRPIRHPDWSAREARTARCPGFPTARPHLRRIELRLAVAVALGLADIAIGDRHRWSGRIPPPTGCHRYQTDRRPPSTEGVVPACADHDTVTIFARTLEDADAAMSAMVDAPGPVAFDVSTCFCRPGRAGDRRARRAAGTRRRLANAFSAPSPPPEAAGMTVRRIDLGPLSRQHDCSTTTLWSPSATTRSGIFDAAVSDQTAGIDPTVGGIIGAANRFSAVGLLRPDDG